MKKGIKVSNTVIRSILNGANLALHSYGHSQLWTSLIAAICPQAVGDTAYRDRFFPICDEIEPFCEELDLFSQIK